MAYFEFGAYFDDIGWGSVLLVREKYKRIRTDGRQVRTHVAIVEKTLGYKLPKFAQVHHVNYDRFDNRPENLVLCPNHDYHFLLHRRQEAQDECGNPNWIRCIQCKKHCDPELVFRKKFAGAMQPFHPECFDAYRLYINSENMRRRKAVKSHI